MVEELKKGLIEYGIECGADKIGITDAEKLVKLPLQNEFNPNEFIKGARSAVSICLAYPKGTLISMGEYVDIHGQVGLARDDGDDRAHGSGIEEGIKAYLDRDF
jgi:hypothetical protein